MSYGENFVKQHLKRSFVGCCVDALINVKLVAIKPVDAAVDSKNKHVAI